MNKEKHDLGFVAGYDDGLRDVALGLTTPNPEFPTRTHPDHRSYRRGYRAGWDDGQQRKATKVPA